jgi:hypothetical protein
VSDYITELRREVVSAHATHRHAAARIRRRRWRPVLAGAVGLAVLIVAIVLAYRSLPAPEPSTEPRIIKVLRIGGSPADGVFAYGSLWVTDYEGRRIVRLDPSARKVIGQVELDQGPDDIAAGAGSLWLIGAAEQHPIARLWRVDPARARVIDELDHPDDFSTIAASADAVWLTAQPGFVRRIPATGGRERRIPVQLPNGVSTSGRSVWVVSQDGSVARIDAGSARIAHRWTRLAPSGDDDASDAIVADPRGAWLLSAGQGRILRLEGDAVTKVLRINPPNEPILARAADGLWVVPSAEPGRASIERIDPRTGLVTATVELGKHYPRALVPVRGGLWVVAGDGTVVLVAT